MERRLQAIRAGAIEIPRIDAVDAIGDQSHSRFSSNVFSLFRRGKHGLNHHQITTCVAVIGSGQGTMMGEFKHARPHISGAKDNTCRLTGQRNIDILCISIVPRGCVGRLLLQGRCIREQFCGVGTNDPPQHVEGQHTNAHHFEQGADGLGLQIALSEIGDHIG